MNTRGTFALAQITLLIFGIIAVGYALGSEARIVSGASVVNYEILEWHKLDKTGGISFKNGDIIQNGKVIGKATSVLDARGRERLGVVIDGETYRVAYGNNVEAWNQEKSIVAQVSSSSSIKTAKTSSCLDPAGNPCGNYGTSYSNSGGAVQGDVKISDGASLAGVSSSSPDLQGAVSPEKLGFWNKLLGIFGLGVEFPLIMTGADVVAGGGLDTNDLQGHTGGSEGSCYNPKNAVGSGNAAGDGQGNKGGGTTTFSTVTAKSLNQAVGKEVSVEINGKPYEGTIEYDKDKGYSLKQASGQSVGIKPGDKISSGNYEGAWNGMGAGFLGNLAEGVQWSMYVVGAIMLVGNLAGMESKQINAFSMAAAAGIMAAKGVIGAMEQWYGTGMTWGNEAFIDSQSSPFLGKMFKGTTNAQGYGTLVGVAVAALVLYATYKTEETKVVSFTCEKWQAPTGGKRCEECNKQGILPCSEYQCKSLGQSCELINKGTTEEQCAWVNRKDVTPPVITLSKEALSKNHRYSPDTRVSPPDTGTKILYEQAKDGCVKAFTPLEFGIKTDEPASCKLDYQRTDSFENMSHYFGGTPAFLYNHTQTMSLPGAENLKQENITIKNDGEYSLFVRCQDSNGNSNLATFVFRFCVEKGPDTTPPLIVGTNLLNGMPITYNKSSAEFEAYLNEPANCKWSHLDKSYEEMEKNMTCSTSVFEMNAQMIYRCKTVLDGIKDEIENKFYIKCEDQPSKPVADRNRNTESYKFVLMGTKPLAISHVGPNGTISDATETVKMTLEVKTIGGYQEGNSSCYYSPTQSDSDYVKFFNTDSYLHTQDLYLPDGDYRYYIKCVDLGGNVDLNYTDFTLETDTEGPLVIRAYNEESNLKIITDEPAECFYGLSDCLYALKDGIKMPSVDENNTQHYVSWDPGKVFYIKCQDKYENQPYPHQCNMIVRPYEEISVDEED